MITNVREKLFIIKYMNLIIFSIYAELNSLCQYMGKNKSFQQEIVTSWGLDRLFLMRD